MIKDEMEKYRDSDRQQEAGVCIVGEVRKDREEIKPSELQERLTEVEEDNKKLAHEIEDRVHKMRKSGL